MNPVLLSVVDNDKNKLYEAINGIPQFDMGDEPVLPKSGLQLEKITNGYNYRYKPKPNQIFPPAVIFNSTVTNANIDTRVFNFVIPAGSINIGDSVDIRFTLPAPPATLTTNITLRSVKEFTNSGVFFRNNASGVNAVISIVGVQAGIATVNSAHFFSANGPRTKLLNTLHDITVEVTCSFATTVVPSSLSYTFSNPEIEFKPSTLESYVADMSLYRKPDEHPYHQDSFWNTKLSSTVVYGAESNPMCDLLQDQWATKIVKSGQRTNIFWIEGSNQPAPAWNGGIAFYQCSDSDPICDVETDLSQVPKTVGPWFSKYTGNILKIKMPNRRLYPGQSSDRILNLISPDKRYVLEVGVYIWDDVLKKHYFGYAHVHDLYGYGHNARFWPILSQTQITNTLSPQTYGFQFGYRAGGQGALGGCIRKADLDAGVVGHMIGMQIDPRLMRSSRVTLVSSDSEAKTFTVRPRSTLTEIMDYTYLFTAGLQVTHNGVNYTCTGVSSFNSTTRHTTFEVVEALQPVVLEDNLFLGANPTTQASAYFDFRRLWPLGECDGGSDNPNGYNGLIPLGQVFAIHPSVDVTALGLTPHGVVIARAFQQYGGIINDITANTFNVFQFESSIDPAIRTAVFADLPAIVNNLVPVLNYGPQTVIDSQADLGITRNKPLVPIY